MTMPGIAFAVLMQAAAPAPASVPATDSGPSTDSGPASDSAPNDYTLEQNWLCRPGRRDACTIPRDAATVAADGTVTDAPFVQAAAPAADCFYVYPTVSLDAPDNSDMVANDEERSVVAAQFARFGGVCRPFAPVYRQITLSALRRAMISGTMRAGDRALIYNDVRDAFRDYLTRDNGGRPFVLYGHSQGAGILKELVAGEVDGQPVQRQMLSALLIGTNVAVPDGKDVGGDFKAVPLCRSADQTGCVVSYMSFRAEAPPPVTSRFGRVEGAKLRAACTNPADLSGTRGMAAADATLLNRGSIVSSAEAAPPWTDAAPTITQGYIKVPGLLSTQCVRTDGFDYLAVTVNGDPADPRTDSIVGDVKIGGTVLADWGLHLIDVNVAEGDLTGLIASQAAAWQTRAGG